MICNVIQEIDFSEFGFEYIDGRNFIQPFGSYRNGFSIAGSDVDLSIITNSYVQERSMLKIVEHFLLKKGIRIK